MANNPQLAVMTHENFVKDVISDGVLESNVFFNELKRRNKVRKNEKGTQIIGVVRKSQHTISQWAAMHNPNVTQPETKERWTHDWGGVFGQYFTDEWDVASNAGEEALFRMQEEDLDDLRDDVNEYFEDYMFADGLSLSPAGIGGLEAFVKKTGTYAGISQTSGTNNYWKANVINGGNSTGSIGSYDTDDANSFPNSKRLLTKLINDCTRGATKGGSNSPDAGFCDRTQWNFLHTQIERQRRVTSLADRLRVGHQNFVWNGIPFFWSDSCPAQTVYIVNWDKLELWCAYNKLARSRSMDSILPIGTVHQMYGKLQMVCRSPRHMGKISATGVT